MKVLLTGATGFLGHHALRQLTDRGIATVAVSRRPLGAFPGVEHIEADLLATPDFRPLLERAGATHLLHLAWYAEHGQYWTSPLNLRWVDATLRLVEAFCEAGGRGIVAAGTCAEYDWRDWHHGVCHEMTTPLQPATLYGTAKDACRRLAAAVCAQHKVPLAWGRIFFPFGEGENKARLIPSLIEVFRGRRAPFGINAEASRDMLHASDVAAGFVALLQAEADGPYNVCAGEPVRLGAVAERLAQLLGADPRGVLDLATARPGDPALLIGDNARIAALGWRPALTLDEALQRAVQENP